MHVHPALSAIVRGVDRNSTQRFRSDELFVALSCFVRSSALRSCRAAGSIQAALPLLILVSLLGTGLVRAGLILGDLEIIDLLVDAGMREALD